MAPAEPAAPKAKRGELQAGRGLLGDVADDVQGVGLRLRVVVLVEDLEAVVDGADRADHVVADLARDERGELEIGRLDALAHLSAPCIALDRMCETERQLGRPSRWISAGAHRTRATGAACKSLSRSDTRAASSMQRLGIGRAGCTGAFAGN